MLVENRDFIIPLGTTFGTVKTRVMWVLSRGLHGYGGGDGDNVCGFTVGMGPRILWG